MVDFCVIVGFTTNQAVHKLHNNEHAFHDNELGELAHSEPIH